ncbi:EF-hand calcium-binding domain-containing protein 12-like [Grus japonensis]|uniref:EF-hand calcium-binding domain-containing protein 12-like n=1 Tax=Grus japonensis TaxID=30415 RepID=A0ABC9XT03_GRUJA
MLLGLGRDTDLPDLGHSYQALDVPCSEEVMQKSMQENLNYFSFILRNRKDTDFILKDLGTLAIRGTVVTMAFCKDFLLRLNKSTYVVEKLLALSQEEEDSLRPTEITSGIEEGLQTAEAWNQGRRQLRTELESFGDIEKWLRQKPSQNDQEKRYRERPKARRADRRAVVQSAVTDSLDALVTPHNLLQKKKLRLVDVFKKAGMERRKIKREDFIKVIKETKVPISDKDLEDAVIFLTSSKPGNFTSPQDLTECQKQWLEVRKGQSQESRTGVEAQFQKATCKTATCPPPAGGTAKGMKPRAPTKPERQLRRLEVPPVNTKPERQNLSCDEMEETGKLSLSRRRWEKLSQEEEDSLRPTEITSGIEEGLQTAEAWNQGRRQLRTELESFGDIEKWLRQKPSQNDQEKRYRERPKARRADRRAVVQSAVTDSLDALVTPHNLLQKKKLRLVDVFKKAGMERRKIKREDFIKVIKETKVPISDKDLEDAVIFLTSSKPGNFTSPQDLTECQKQWLEVRKGQSQESRTGVEAQFQKATCKTATCPPPAGGTAKGMKPRAPTKPERQLRRLEVPPVNTKPERQNLSCDEMEETGKLSLSRRRWEKLSQEEEDSLRPTEITSGIEEGLQTAEAWNQGRRQLRTELESFGDIEKWLRQKPAQNDQEKRYRERPKARRADRRAVVQSAVTDSLDALVTPHNLLQKKKLRLVDVFKKAGMERRKIKREDFIKVIKETKVPISDKDLEDAVIFLTSSKPGNFTSPQDLTECQKQWLEVRKGQSQESRTGVEAQFQKATCKTATCPPPAGGTAKGMKPRAPTKPERQLRRLEVPPVNTKPERQNLSCDEMEETGKLSLSRRRWEKLSQEEEDSLRPTEITSGIEEGLQTAEAWNQGRRQLRTELESFGDIEKWLRQKPSQNDQEKRYRERPKARRADRRAVVQSAVTDSLDALVTPHNLLQKKKLRLVDVFKKAGMERRKIKREDFIKVIKETKVPISDKDLEDAVIFLTSSKPGNFTSPQDLTECQKQWLEVRKGQSQESRTGVEAQFQKATCKTATCPPPAGGTAKGMKPRAPTKPERQLRRLEVPPVNTKPERQNLSCDEMEETGKLSLSRRRWEKVPCLWEENKRTCTPWRMRAL